MAKEAGGENEIYPEGEEARSGLMAPILAARRADYQRAERYLLYYDRERKSYLERKAEFLSARPVDENASRRGAVSHPTESAAIQSVRFDEASEEYQWLRAVDIVIRGLCDSKRFLIRLRRDALRANGGKHTGRKAWVAYVQVRYSEMVGRAVGERTIRHWNAELIWRIVDVHLRLMKNN